MSDVTSIRVYALANFDDDELETIKGYMVGDKEGIDLNFNTWQYEDDGSESDIISQYKTTTDRVMIFVDRAGLEDNSYLVADGRCVSQEWYVQTVVENYGFTYSEAWLGDDNATPILDNAAVPYARINALAKIDVVDLWTSYEENEEYMLTDYLEIGDISFCYTDDADGVTAQLGDLNIGEQEEVVEEEEE
ncbi:hypothetical protein H2198_007641 [Neophaeococcomyces mojaviensis]|uniref:Uncharacterized protein n=1 Tax=Neophaeococcomyces mojaviensis TaxID=3383035 RepID=A0ACC2ZZJ3_9EURO|nr:hypothetical protein H2198_007641 [Knufia sp. JES_112]